MYISGVDDMVVVLSVLEHVVVAIVKDMDEVYVIGSLHINVVMSS